MRTWQPPHNEFMLMSVLQLSTRTKAIILQPMGASHLYLNAGIDALRSIRPLAARPRQLTSRTKTRCRQSCANDGFIAVRKL